MNPEPKPVGLVGTLVRARVGAYAVSADRAIIPLPAIIDAHVAVLHIILLHPPKIVEVEPLAVLQQPPATVE
jgi:hypothetical protein